MTNDIAVFGIFRNENKLFPVWYKYYSKIFGRENIYVYDDCTIDGTFNRFNFPNYEKLNLERHFTIETKRLGVGDYGTLWNFIVGKYKELLTKYKWVINADADDFIIANPDKYNNLKHFIESNKADEYFRCTAFEVLQMKDEEKIIWNKKILDQRKYWIRITNLDKTSITRVKLDFGGSWTQGNHYVHGRMNEPTNPDLLLIHLHRIDYETYRDKYFIEDKSIKTDKAFCAQYGGYPLFWNEQALNEHFYDPAANRRFGAHGAEKMLIPEKYKGVF